MTQMDGTRAERRLLRGFESRCRHKLETAPGAGRDTKARMPGKTGQADQPERDNINGI